MSLQQVKIKPFDIHLGEDHDISHIDASVNNSIAAKGSSALRYLKEVIIKGLDMMMEQGLRLEADLYFLLHTTADHAEGITSFRGKKNPEYLGK